MAKLLIVDDDARLRRLVRTYGELDSRVCHFIQYIIIKFFLILQGFPCFFNTHMI